MERDFNNDEFEFFLKQKADQYKIYPSEKSWRNIHNSLHSRWKWFTLGGSLILLSGLFFFSNDLTFSNSSKISAKNKTLTSQVTATSTNSSRGTSTIATDPFFSNNGKTLQANNSESKAVAANSTADVITKDLKNPVSTLKIPTKIENTSTLQLAASKTNHSKVHVDNLQASLLPISEETNLEKIINIDAPVLGQHVEDESNLLSKISMHTAPLIETEAALSGEINWMEQMTAIKLTAPKSNPFHLQFYFSPSVSYRKLADNKTTSNTNQVNTPIAASNSNINRYVDHKPSIGAELGSNILFTAGRNLTFKTGLQLNYSRYTIKAYKFYFEKASIALNTLGPIGDTLTSYTSFRNFSGYSPEELQNQYLQISVPIGAELKLLGNKRLQLNIAGTIQPTYLLLNDTYLLSTDYVNYAKEPSLVRKWNVHTSMEAFISYKVGGVRWQVGPQFRYQLMSSYNDRYPIKEYLFEYGVKVGVSKTIR